MLTSSSLLLAANPPDEVVGMSALPDPAQEALKQEATRIGGQIGELRAHGNGHVVYKANLRGTPGEIVTVNGDGRVLSRQRP